MLLSHSITLHKAGKGWIHFTWRGFLLLGQMNSLPVLILLEADKAKSTQHDTAQFIGCQDATCLLTQLIGLIHYLHHTYKLGLVCWSTQENPHHRSNQTHNVHQKTHGLTTKMAMFWCDWISFLFSSGLCRWLTAAKSDGALHNDVELHATHLSTIFHQVDKLWHGFDVQIIVLQIRIQLFMSIQQHLQSSLCWLSGLGQHLIHTAEICNRLLLLPRLWFWAARAIIARSWKQIYLQIQPGKADGSHCITNSIHPNGSQAHLCSLSHSCC